MDVKLPDGTVIRNVPEGTTREQLAAKLKGAHGTRVRTLPSMPDESPTSPRNLGGAAVEPTLSMASGAVAAPVSGLAGMGAGLANAMGITNTPAADVTNTVRNAMTFEPRTTGGRNAMTAFTAPAQAVGSLFEDKPGTVAKPGISRGHFGGAGSTSSGDWSPAVKTAAQTYMEGLGQFAGAKGAGGAAADARFLPRPKISPEVRRLAGEGVVMTPGQRRGGIPNALEEKASKILPPIGNARAKAVEQWNTARLNDALKDAGGIAVPKDVTGRDAIRHAYQQFQDRYNTVLSKMKADLNGAPAGSKLPVPKGQKWAPGSFRDSLEKVRTVGRNLDPAQRNTLNDILDNQVIGKFTQAGKASGETVKEIEETLRTEAEAHESGTYQDRKLSQALYQVRADLKAALQRDNPTLAPQLENIDRGYAKYKLSARASNYSTTKYGNYTPGQRLQAVKARDATKDKNAFSTGTAAGQKEAEGAQSVLGNTQPDSGTPMGLGLLASLGVFGSGGAVGHPLLGAGIAASPLLYSQPALRFLQDTALSGKTPVGNTAGYVLPFGAEQNGDGR